MANLPGRLTEQEIRAQPHAWADALSAFHSCRPQVIALWRSASPGQVLLTGCGSFHYLALSAVHLLRSAPRVPCQAVPSSEVLFVDKGMATLWMPSLALSVARARGVDPDTPRFLEPVVTWDTSLQIGGAR